MLSSEPLTALGAVCALSPLPALDDFSAGRARAVLADVEGLVTGWGCPAIDADVLAAARAPRAVVPLRRP